MRRLVRALAYAGYAILWLVLLWCAFACEMPYPPWYTGYFCERDDTGLPGTYAKDTLLIHVPDSAAAMNLCRTLAQNQASDWAIMLFLQNRCFRSWPDDSVIEIEQRDMSKCDIQYYGPYGPGRNREPGLPGGGSI